VTDAQSSEELDERKAELDRKEQRARELAEHYVDAIDALKAIGRHDLATDEAAANARMLRTMLRQMRRENDPKRGINHEKDQLRQRRAELKREADDAEVWR
jgi:hypothetical protein